MQTYRQDLIEELQRLVKQESFNVKYAKDIS